MTTDTPDIRWDLINKPVMTAEEWKSLTDAEWKERMGKPEFMSIANDHAAGKILGLVDDKEGNTWVFLKTWTNWMYSPYAAFLRIQGQSIDIAARATWAGEPFPPVQEGDVPLVYYKAWMELTGLPLPFEEGGIAFKLPFKPDKITLVDK